MTEIAEVESLSRFSNGELLQDFARRADFNAPDPMLAHFDQGQIIRELHSRVTKDKLTKPQHDVFTQLLRRIGALLPERPKEQSRFVSYTAFELLTALQDHIVEIKPLRLSNISDASVGDIFAELRMRSAANQLTQPQKDAFTLLEQMHARKPAPPIEVPRPMQPPPVDVKRPDAPRTTSRPEVAPRPILANEETKRHVENPKAKEIVAAITRKIVHGKVRRGTVINGQPITNPEGFYDHGSEKDKVLSREASNNYEGILGGAIYKYHRENPQYVNADTLVVMPSKEKGRVLWQLNFFQDLKAPDGRGSYTPAYVVWELPQVQSQLLWKELNSDPDVVDDIFKLAFQGLEDPDPNAKEPLGMRRVKTNRLYVANQQILDQIPNGYIGPRDIQAQMDKLYKLVYKRGPHGVGDPTSENPKR